MSVGVQYVADLRYNVVEDTATYLLNTIAPFYIKQSKYTEIKMKLM